MQGGSSEHMHCHLFILYHTCFFQVSLANNMLGTGVPKVSTKMCQMEMEALGIWSYVKQRDHGSRYDQELPFIPWIQCVCLVLLGQIYSQGIYVTWLGPSFLLLGHEGFISFLPSWLLGPVSNPWNSRGLLFVVFGLEGVLQGSSICPFSFSPVLFFITLPPSPRWFFFHIFNIYRK